MVWIMLPLLYQEKFIVLHKLSVPKFTNQQ